MTVATEFDRAAWLAWRRMGIGASDVAAILGISPWASPWSVWAEKTGLLPGDEGNEVMEAGRWLELAIGPWFADRTGLHVAGEQTWCTHHEQSHHRCTVDGFVLEKPENQHLTEKEWRYALEHALGVLEIKTTGFGNRWDEIPAHYQSQAQWQMHVTGRERVWFAVLHGRRLEVYELERDQADIDLMVERVDEFWYDHVLAAVPPLVDGSDATTRALAAVYPEHTPNTSVEIPYTDLDLWSNAKKEERWWHAQEKQHANAIKAALGDAEEGTVDGQRVVSWRSQHRKSYVVAEADFRVLRSHSPKEKP